MNTTSSSLCCLEFPQASRLTCLHHERTCLSAWIGVASLARRLFSSLSSVGSLVVESTSDSVYSGACGSLDWLNDAGIWRINCASGVPWGKILICRRVAWLGNNRKGVSTSSESLTIR